MSLSLYQICKSGYLYLKKAIVSVINDLVTDQRVHKSCITLQKAGFEVLLIGRKLPGSLPVNDRGYKTHRMKLLFTRGPMFYASYNFRLFFYLLFHRADFLLANDLDTLLPNFLISRIKRIELLYDSHEYFTETPELVNRKAVQKVWKTIEEFILPRLKEMITVNDSIAQLFSRKYQIPVHVVRNIPAKYISNGPLTRTAAGLPENKKILILQGAGINVDRGAEELVEAMKFLPGFFLIIIGGGDVLAKLVDISNHNNLNDSILFLPKMPYQQMMQYTQLADLGLTLDKDTNINYKFSLPNKLFDYIHAGIPVLASPLPEIKNIIDTYQIGTYIVNHQPESIALTITSIFNDENQWKTWKNNCLIASELLCWENESKNLTQIYAKYS